MYKQGPQARGGRTGSFNHHGEILVERPCDSFEILLENNLLSEDDRAVEPPRCPQEEAVILSHLLAVVG